MVLSQILNPTDNHQARISKADKDFFKNLDFKELKIPVKIRNIRKIKKKKEFHCY